MNTYQIIAGLAQKKGLSIRALEQRMGYSNGYIGSWKRQTPNSNELARLADYFNVSVDYLLGRTEEPTVMADNPSDPYAKMAMRFRKNEMEIAEEDREEYRRDVNTLLEFVEYRMKQLDDEKRKKGK